MLQVDTDMTELANCDGLKIHFRRDTWVRIPLSVYLYLDKYN